MKGRPLKGRTILVTRPGGLSNYLRDNICKAEGKVLHLPSISIEPLEDLAEAKRLLSCLCEFDILIFVSRNAVKYASQLMPDIVERVTAKTVFAIGAGTYGELQGIGITDASYTDSNTGSDALLDMDELQPENVTDKKILIIRGLGGRELLSEKLHIRGAEVQYAELYRRTKPAVGAATIRNIWLTEKPDVVLVTSAEGLRNLLEITGEEERPLFLKTRLIVISPRLKGVAESAGFNAEIKIARGYSDNDFMLALTELFEATENER